MTAGISSPNGERLDTLDTIELCLSACTSDVTCVGVDFNINNDRCFHHFDSDDFDTENDNSNVQQYVKVDNCSMYLIMLLDFCLICD